MLERLANPFWGIAFDDDLAGGGGDKDGGGGDPPPDKDANTGGDGGGSGGGDKDKQFTQADVDRIVSERAKRAGDSAVTKLLENLGFSKADDLKAMIKSHKEAEDAKKSELEKLADAAKTAAEEKAKAERERDEAKTERDGILIRHAIELKAVELGFANPRDAYELLVADESLSEVEISEGGKVSGFEKKLEELAKSERLPMKGSPGSAGLGTPRKPAPGKQQQKQGQGQEEPTTPAIRF